MEDKINYDIILIHPPATYDFRKQSIFAGPISFTVPESTNQFIVPSTGILSIADYLDRHGYNVVVDNIGERMTMSESFDVEAHIKDYSAKVYAIELQWVRHSQGAIEIARLCKELHPEALVIIGGLTATIFHEEIILKYDFIDFIIRGEAEKPFLLLMNALKNHEELSKVPNLTFHMDSENFVKSTALMEPDTSLDDFEFTRFDLLEPQKAVFSSNWPAHWALPICRGCTQNCVSCGGSAYSYQKYLGRKSPAFRSPEKIVEDLYKVSEQGIKLVYLYQDPRIGGRKYWSRLIKLLQNADIKLEQITMQLFGPVEDEYIRELSKIRVPVALTTSPESGVYSVRKAHGKNYTNEELFSTIDICKKYDIPLDVFTMVALGNDTPKTVKETWQMWDKLCITNRSKNGTAPNLFPYSFGPMILLDPGSIAFDFPDKYGYRPIFRTLEDYIKGQTRPSWHQWISYETKFLSKDLITELIIDSIEHSIDLRESYGYYSKDEADKYRSFFVEQSKEIINIINRIENLYNNDE